MNRSVANWMVEKHRCTEKEKRLRNLLVTNSGLRIEGGRWLDSRFDLESLDTEVLLVKVLKTLTEDRNKLMSLNEVGPNAIVNEDSNEFGYSKNVSGELKRLLMKRPKFSNIESVREFISQMARTIIACNPNASILSPDFALLANNYGLAQETTALQTQMYELQTENERLTRNVAQLTQDNESLTEGYRTLQLAYQDLLDRGEGGTREVGELKNELQTVQNERDSLRSRIESLVTNHDKDMDKLRRSMQNACDKKLQQLTNECDANITAIQKQYRNCDPEVLKRRFEEKENRMLRMIDKLRAEQQILKDRIKYINDKNNTGNNNDKTSTRVQQLLDENETLNIRHNKLNEDYSEANVKIDQLLTTNDSLRGQLIAANVTINDLRTQVNELKLDVGRVTDELQQCLQRAMESSKSVQVLKLENDELQNELKNELKIKSETYIKSEQPPPPPPPSQSVSMENYCFNFVNEIAVKLGVYVETEDYTVTARSVLADLNTLGSIFDIVSQSRVSYPRPSIRTSNLELLRAWMIRVDAIVKECEETEKLFEEQLVECENNIQRNKQVFIADIKKLEEDLTQKFVYELQHITENNRLYLHVYNVISIINNLTSRQPLTLNTPDVISDVDVETAEQQLRIIANYGQFLKNLIDSLRKYINTEDDTFTIITYNQRKQQKFIDDVEQTMLNINYDWDYENEPLVLDNVDPYTLNTTTVDEIVAALEEPTTSERTITSEPVVIRELEQQNIEFEQPVVIHGSVIIPTDVPKTAVITEPTIVPKTAVITEPTIVLEPIEPTPNMSQPQPIASTSKTTKKRRVALTTLTTTPPRVLRTKINKPSLEFKSFSEVMNNLANQMLKTYVPQGQTSTEHEQIDKLAKFEIDQYVNVNKRAKEYEILKEQTAAATSGSVDVEDVAGEEQTEDEEPRLSDLEFINDEGVKETRVSKKRKRRPNDSSVSVKIKKRNRRVVSSDTEGEEENDEKSIVNTV
uniref:Uncharacterized protein n=1 Tax=Erinnyis ello granulovirus TaxID=307444 RepID=A0A288WIZ2_9BBAC|nr:hypothetical protein EREL_044 [Erinnyis ello granulovirus]